MKGIKEVYPFASGIIPLSREKYRTGYSSVISATKEQTGRGLGTFSMKLLGEEILGGRVEFTSSAQNGTVFKLDLPDDPEKKMQKDE